MKSTTTTDLKQQIQQLIERLPPEQLPQLLQLLQTWLAYTSVSGVNGNTHKLPAADASLEATQPWLKYINRLKDSPNWDEFLKAMDEARLASESPVGV